MIKPVLFISLLAVSVSAWACSNSGDTGSEGVATQSAAIKGHIGNGTGTDVAGFGGPGAVKSSVTVSAKTIDASTGATTSVAQSAVAADGTYTLAVPAHQAPMVVEALDAAGNVVVRALVEGALVAGKTVTAQPLTTESSVEAAVLLDIATTGTAVASIDTAALRARIDAATAMVVHDAGNQASVAAADVHALGVAVLASQASEQASLTAAGVSTASYLAGELGASDALTTSLNAGTSVAQANTDFTTALAALGGQLGVSASDLGNAAMAASASASTAIAAESTSTALTDAFNHTQAMLESTAIAASMSDAFTTAGVTVDVMQQLQTANTALLTQVGAATDATTLAAAFDGWRTSVRGTITATDGLLATVLGVTSTATAAYTMTVSSIMDLDATLQAALAASVAASKDAAGSIDATKLAGLVTQAYTTFNASVQAGVTTSAIGLTTKDNALMTSVFVNSSSSF